MRSRFQSFGGCEQVAAVCFRWGSHGIEFLLVRTRGGRWTFPKGRTEPDLTHAQAAAMEAFEEAGVHGRIEQAAFACYTGRKRAKNRQSGETRLLVHAHLCQVSWLAAPQESNRSPRWFLAEKAKRRLQEQRTAGDGAQLARVVDCAVARIQRLRDGSATRNDALQKVQFEAFQGGRIQVQQASYGHIRQQYGTGQFAAIALAVDAYLWKALRLDPGDQFDGSAELPSGENHNCGASSERGTDSTIAPKRLVTYLTTPGLRRRASCRWSDLT